MKYRLKKDLPFAKAGEEVWTDSFHIYIKGNVRMRGTDRKEDIYLGLLSDLVDNGWVEEVKPREWEVNEWMGDIYNKGSIIMTTADQIQPKRIKVREVIE